MADLDAYISAGALLDVEPGFRLENQAAQPPTSLVTNDVGYRTQIESDLRRRPRCAQGYYQQIVSEGHGVWVWTYKPCDKWECSACGPRRRKTELVPEIQEGMKWAREMGWPLRFVSPTWQADDPGAQPTPAGAKRRREDVAHLAQWVRRSGGLFEYLRVAEGHKSGKVHYHFLVVMPYIDQRELSKKWKDFARGSFRVDIRAVGIRCQRCWPGADASSQEKRRSMIIPPPGKGECSCCGYTPDWSQTWVMEMVAYEAALEISKYLTKEWTGKWADTLRNGKMGPPLGSPKRITRTKGWAERCQVKDLTEKQGICACCDEKHIFKIVSVESVVAAIEPLLEWAVDTHAGFFPTGGQVCQCFEPSKWFEGGMAPPPEPKNKGPGQSFDDYYARGERVGDWPIVVCDSEAQGTPRQIQLIDTWK